MTAPRTFAQWLRRERKAHGLTQLELAQQAGLGRTYVTALESGSVTLPTLQTRLALHHILGTSDDELISIGLLAVDPVTGDEYSPSSSPPSSEGASNSRRSGSDTEQPPALLAETRGKIVRLLDERDIPAAVLNGIVSMLEGFPPTLPPDTP